jgi:hypothetical protein
MKNLKIGLCATAVAMAVAAGSMTTASAASWRIPATAPGVSDVQQINHLRERRRHDRFERRGDHAYYRGHRGYRHKRRGYREYYGYWFPAAAFIGGVIVGNMIGPDRRPIYRHDDNYGLHVAWCDDHYRSYRVSDDTFQPYHGPRRRCNSPYN